MHRYFIKTPWWVRKIYPSFLWKLPATENEVYLSFDDGPHPVITPWVLDLLKEFGAKASFFCIGNNVVRYPEVYRRIVNEGHSVGNHTYDHLNGWKTGDQVYIENIRKAAGVISSNLFRPPYGRIRPSQARQLSEAMDYARPKLVMWDVLSGDFDSHFSPENCYNNVIKHVRPGSIIVFHDSEKAFKNLEKILREILVELKNRGYKMEKIAAQALGS